MTRAGGMITYRAHHVLFTWLKSLFSYGRFIWDPYILNIKISKVVEIIYMNSICWNIYYNIISDQIPSKLFLLYVRTTLLH